MATLKNTIIDDTGYLQLPSGTTAQRPVTPTSGYMRWNTTESYVEVYNGTDWANIGGTNQTTPVLSGLIYYIDAGISTSYNGGTTANDISGNNGSLTLYNGPTHNSGGKFIQFDGNNDYALTSTISGYKSLFFAFNRQGSGGYIGDARTESPGGWLWNTNFGPDWNLGYVNGTSVGSALQSSTTSIPNNQWSTLYAQNSGVRTGDIYLWSRYTVEEYCPAQLGAVLAYNRDLSAAEILENHNHFSSIYNI